MRPLFSIPALAAGVLLSAPGAADSFRCRSMLVNSGDTVDALLARCGKPAEVTSRSVLRPPIVWYGSRMVRVPGDMIETKVETWLYNFGPGKLMQKVEIEGGYVTSVTTLGYGHN